MLVVTRRPEEKVILSNGVKILIAAVKGDHVRLAIEAPSWVDIWREEIRPGEPEPTTEKPPLPPILQALIDAVAEMRHNQREYLRTESLAALSAARTAERRVDRILQDLTTPRLF